MILGIDASQANRKNRSGTEWYAFNLIKEFKQLLRGRGDVEVVLYLRDAPQADLASDLPTNFTFKILRWPIKYFWGQIRLSWEMLFHPPDILFCPAHTIPLIHPYPLSVSPFPPGGGEGGGASFSPMIRGRLRGGRTFTTLHDIGFEDNPELYDKLSLWYHKFSAWFAVKKASHIFTISEFSKKRIIDRYKCNPGKISVIYLGIAQLSSIEESSATLEKYNLSEKDYILFIGRLEPKKNILGMVKAYEKYLSLRGVSTRPLAERDDEAIFPRDGIAAHPSGARNDDDVPDLVLAGRKVRIKDVEEYLAARPELSKRVKFIGYVENQDLAALYTGAAIFLFPTFYEGFGLPILEAQACGTPVITSNITSNPEITGDGAVIIDPRNIDQIAGAIKELSTNNTKREQIVKAGFQNVKRFSWAKTAKETLDVILSSPT